MVFTIVIHVIPKGLTFQGILNHVGPLVLTIWLWLGEGLNAGTHLTDVLEAWGCVNVHVLGGEGHVGGEGACGGEGHVLGGRGIWG